MCELTWFAYLKNYDNDWEVLKNIKGKVAVICFVEYKYDVKSSP